MIFEIWLISHPPSTSPIRSSGITTCPLWRCDVFLQYRQAPGSLTLLKPTVAPAGCDLTKRWRINVISNRSVPTDAVLPHIVYRDVEQAISWLSRALGFVERYRY